MNRDTAIRSTIATRAGRTVGYVTCRRPTLRSVVAIDKLLGIDAEHEHVRLSGLRVLEDLGRVQHVARRFFEVPPDEGGAWSASRSRARNATMFVRGGVTMDSVMQASIVVFSVLVLGTEILRQATAITALRRAGQRPAGWGNWRVTSEMRAYKDLLVREGRSLRWWRLWWILYLTTVAAMFVFAGYVILHREGV
jgi:hypothetical protein